MPDQLETWLFDDLLPFWAVHGVDTEAGGFHERLGPDRRPVTAGGKRTMVQARQIYVFTQTALLERLPQGAGLAHAGRDFLLSHCRHPDGGWRFRVTQAGAPMDDTRDLYAHAFVLYALAWLFRLDGNDASRTLAGETMAFLDGSMAHAKGGYHEALNADGDPDDTERRQNPHMHLFEAFLEWYAATQDGIWLDRARAIAVLLRDRFCVGKTVREYFDGALVPLPGDRGRIVEPGHLFEWTWLLHRYRQLSGDTQYDTLAGDLYDIAEAHGIEPATGGVFDAIAPDGTPLQRSRRFWPQTEAIKGHIARLEATGDPRFEERLGHQIGSLCGAHIEGVPAGGWREHLGEDGRDIVADMPASSLYHVTLAVAELARLRMP